MKPPLTVEAKVAQDLRTWLASELDHLNASNTNQFAHHVVTIFLHENLDFDDEPFFAEEDFLMDIRHIKQGKTRERRKKAAVQFLRRAVSCDEPNELEIQGVVDELIVKIEETKLKMNSKTALKRSLLTPLDINIEEHGKQRYSRKNSCEKYNDAFPSLSGDDSPCRDVPNNVKAASVWNQPSHGKENTKVKPPKTSQRKTQQHKNSSLSFSCPDEAHACCVAMSVASRVFAESSHTSPEAAEMPFVASSSTSVSEFEGIGCWKSAFTPASFFRFFQPISGLIRARLKPGLDVKATVFNPVVTYHKDNNLCNHDKSMKPKSRRESQFVPIMDTQTIMEMDNLIAETLEDMEVEMIVDKARQVKKRHKKKTVVKEKPLAYNHHSDIDDSAKIKTFPKHHGDFWQKMNHKGFLGLYPIVEKHGGVGHQDFSTSKSQNGHSGQEDGMNAVTLARWSIDIDTGGTFERASEFYPAGNIGEEDEDETTATGYSSSSDDDESALDCLPSLVNDDLKTISTCSSFDDAFLPSSDSEQYHRWSKMSALEDETEFDFDFDPLGLERLYDPPFTTDTSGYYGQEVDLVKEVEDILGGNRGDDVFVGLWPGPWSDTPWDNIQRDLMMDMKFESLCHKMAQWDSMMLPSLLSSCLTSQADQLLQSAFVNSFFSGDLSEMNHCEEAPPVLQCTEVEKYLFTSQYSSDFSRSDSSREVVQGATCSSWLENSCALGIQCPFSHPSI